MPRFVILEHDHPHLHWDLMLEAGDTLQTWRLAAPPGQAGAAIDALELGPHRKAYLDYEGPIGGNRGTVRRWDAGVFTEDPCAELDTRRLCLQGTRINGPVLLTRMEGVHWRMTER